MKTKFLEIRDKGTTIPVLAIQMTPDDRNAVFAVDHMFMRHTGFDTEPERSGHDATIYIVWLEQKRYTYNAQDWKDRTMTPAHIWIKENWVGLKSGQVVDVEWIKGGKRGGPAEAEIYNP